MTDAGETARTMAQRAGAPGAPLQDGRLRSTGAWCAVRSERRPGRAGVLPSPGTALVADGDRRRVDETEEHGEHA
jgi:hypothetical protein